MITFRNMVKENVSQELRLKYLDKTRTRLFEEIDQKVLISKTHNNVYMVSYYISLPLILVYAIT